MIGAIAWFPIGMAVSAMTETGRRLRRLALHHRPGRGRAGGTTGAMAVSSPCPEKEPRHRLHLCRHPAGLLPGLLLAIFLLPIIGWRGMFLLGALPWSPRLPPLAI